MELGSDICYCGKFYAKYRASADHAFCGDRATVNICNPSSDGKAKSCARDLARSGFVRAIKALEDGLEVVTFDADTGIFDCDVRFGFRHCQSDFAAASRR